ncbi:DMT family transporter [Terasakiella sp. SH-1]|uniref:DMT family transporter n=1 Tax=Terasakiella sp. SH-1 TaxID=2560057 RepID=UPI0010744CFB|nr:DMT family transporter [Terasakiella sp. SH-1]
MKEESPLTEEKTSPLLGFICAVLMAGIWAGFIVVSRLGALSPLTIYDMAALRFGFAGLLLLPATYLWWPRHLSLFQILVLAGGTGVPYVLLAYTGFLFAPVSHGGVFINGTLPIFATLITVVWLGSRPSVQTWIAIFVILSGCALTAFAKDGFGNLNSLIGDAFFMTAAFSMAVYMPATRTWTVSLKELLAMVPIVNAVLFIPIWWLFLPTNLAASPMEDILIQMIYQGLGPSILGLIFFYLAIKHLGTTPTAAIVAVVPTIASLAGIPILQETPVPLEWIGMFLVTTGIWLTLRAD